MKVIAFYKNKTKHILVLDDLKEGIHQQDFFFEIAGVHSSLEIMFIESLALPAGIIEALVRLKEQYGKANLKIYTTTDALSQYLFDLSIPNFQLHTSRQMSLQNDFGALITVSEEECRDLLSGICRIYGYDFQNYQIENIKRILSQTILKEGLENFEIFKEKVLHEQEFFQSLFLRLAINVTSFFRNPILFKILREEVFSYLASFPYLRIWSAGASTGEEAYSLAIVLKELNMLEKSIIYATDFNSLVLQKAQNGLYSLKSIEEATENYLKSGGTTCFKDYFDINQCYAKIDKSLKEKVVFFKHNLTTDKVFNEFHLIICKNVLIYFDGELQERVINVYQQALHRNGFLVLGKSENLFSNSNNFKRYKEGFNIFKQKLE